MKDILKLIVVLTLICLASGLTLAAVRGATKETIEKTILKEVQGPAVAALLADKDNDPINDSFKLPAGKDKKGRDAFKTIFPAKKGGQVTALALEGDGKGFEGPISVMVGIDPQGKLTGIAITKQSETPGIGSKIAEPVFTDQFKDLSVDESINVDGISGATYSTQGVFEAVQQAVNFYKENQKQILAQAGQ